MSTRLLYLDSSAVVKWVVREDESPFLSELLTGWPEQVSSVLARVEVRRALRRAGAADSVLKRGEQALQRINLIRLDDAILGVASALEPRALRSLDALHLASALSVRAGLTAFVTYDRRLAEAATQAGLAVWSPGAGQ